MTDKPLHWAGKRQLKAHKVLRCTFTHIHAYSLTAVVLLTYYSFTLEKTEDELNLHQQQGCPSVHITLPVCLSLSFTHTHTHSQTLRQFSLFETLFSARGKKNQNTEVTCDWGCCSKVSIMEITQLVCTFQTAAPKHTERKLSKWFNKALRKKAYCQRTWDLSDYFPHSTYEEKTTCKNKRWVLHQHPSILGLSLPLGQAALKVNEYCCLTFTRLNQPGNCW